MDHHAIEVPEVNVGKLNRQDALDFSVNLLALLLVERAAAFLDQLVDTWVGIVTAIGTFGRETAGMKGVFKDIRVFIAVAQPAQGIHLEGAFSHISIKGCELKGADVECNANFP